MLNIWYLCCSESFIEDIYYSYIVILDIQNHISFWNIHQFILFRVTMRNPRKLCLQISDYATYIDNLTKSNVWLHPVFRLPNDLFGTFCISVPWPHSVLCIVYFYNLYFSSYKKNIVARQYFGILAYRNFELHRYIFSTLAYPTFGLYSSFSLHSHL